VARANPSFKLLVPETVHLNRLLNLRQMLVRHHDRILYTRFRDNPSAEAADAFQRGALGDAMGDVMGDAMKNESRAYRDYCTKLDQPQALKLFVSVRWGTWARRATNEVTVCAPAQPGARAAGRVHGVHRYPVEQKRRERDVRPPGRLVRCETEPTV
jgi:hypothetical protein